jgi:hypothetical protein
LIREENLIATNNGDFEQVTGKLYKKP